MSTEVLSGDLAAFRLPALLQLLEGEAHTGWLGIGKVGGVAFREGELVEAMYGAWTGRAGLMELFLEDSGSFKVEVWPEVQGKSLGPMLNLLMEGLRLADDWNRLAQVHLSWQEGRSQALAGELDVLRPVLDGTLSTAQLVSAAGLRRTAVVDPLLKLLEQGALRSKQVISERTVAETAVRVDYFHAMDQGRELLRAGRKQEAVAAFQSALSARPGDRLASIQLRRAHALLTP